MGSFYSQIKSQEIITEMTKSGKLNNPLYEDKSLNPATKPALEILHLITLYIGPFVEGSSKELDALLSIVNHNIEFKIVDKISNALQNAIGTFGVQPSEIIKMQVKFLETLRKSSMLIGGNKSIASCFEIKKEEVTKCLYCEGITTVANEPSFHFPIILDGSHSSLQGYLYNALASKILKGEEKVECPYCYCKQEAKKFTEVTSFPDIMIFSIINPNSIKTTYVDMRSLLMHTIEFTGKKVLNAQPQRYELIGAVMLSDEGKHVSLLRLEKNWISVSEYYGITIVEDARLFGCMDPPPQPLTIVQLVYTKPSLITHK